jgi:hypothetical protein
MLSQQLQTDGHGVWTLQPCGLQPSASHFRVATPIFTPPQPIPLSPWSLEPAASASNHRLKKVILCHGRCFFQLRLACGFDYARDWQGVAPAFTKGITAAHVAVGEYGCWFLDMLPMDVQSCKGVRAGAFQNIGFSVLTNYQAGMPACYTTAFMCLWVGMRVCETQQVIKELVCFCVRVHLMCLTMVDSVCQRGVYDVGTASQKCANAEQCTHFTLSTGRA